MIFSFLLNTPNQARPFGQLECFINIPNPRSNSVAQTCLSHKKIPFTTLKSNKSNKIALKLYILVENEPNTLLYMYMYLLHSYKEMFIMIIESCRYLEQEDYYLLYKEIKWKNYYFSLFQFTLRDLFRHYLDKRMFGENLLRQM